MEDKAITQPNPYAQSGYKYQRLKVRGWYLTKEHIKELWENNKNKYISFLFSLFLYTFYT